MTIKIEKGVPMLHRSDAGVSKYPFKDMDIGDSFRVEKPKAANCLYTPAIRAGIKISMRADGDGYVRVWRVK